MYTPSKYPNTNKYKVVQIWPGQTVTSLHTISPGHIWTTLYYSDRGESLKTDERNQSVTEELLISNYVVLWLIVLARNCWLAIF
jgi:hypothetical protein